MITYPFTWQIAIGNAGPATALRSMRAKLFFLLLVCKHYSNVYTISQFFPKRVSGGRSPDLMGGTGNPFPSWTVIGPAFLV